MAEPILLAETLNELVEFATSVVDCDSCFVYVLEGDELVLRASKNPHPQSLGRLKIKAAQGIAGWLAQHWKPVAVSQNAYKDTRFVLFNGQSEQCFESFLSVPVSMCGRFVAVINLQNRSQYQYTEREISLIATVGFMAAAGIEQARLESENAQLVAKLETRTFVERAKGILQRDLKISEDAAYRVMQRESQERRKSMKEIAEAVILSDSLRATCIS
jgi:uroporphyrinogen-III synthase